MATILSGDRLPPRGAMCDVCGKNTETQDIAYEILKNGGRRYYHADCYEWMLTAGQKETLREELRKVKILEQSFNEALNSWTKERK